MLPLSKEILQYNLKVTKAMHQIKIMVQACITRPDKFSSVRLRDKTFALNICIFVYLPLLLRLKSMITRNAGIG